MKIHIHKDFQRGVSASASLLPSNFPLWPSTIRLAFALLENHKKSLNCQFAIRVCFSEFIFCLFHCCFFFLHCLFWFIYVFELYYYFFSCCWHSFSVPCSLLLYDFVKHEKSKDLLYSIDQLFCGKCSLCVKHKARGRRTRSPKQRTTWKSWSKVVVAFPR